MSRGNARAVIFVDDDDRRLWLHILDRVLGECGWRCLAYCLMPNHYHLVVRTPEPNLSTGMQSLNGEYGRWFNRRQERVGHVYQGRFRAKPVTGEPYLMELLRYLPLNPVRAGLCERPEDWPWSSYAEAVGAAPARRVALREMMTRFGGDLTEARRQYTQYVAEGLRHGVVEDPWCGRWPTPADRPPLEAVLEHDRSGPALLLAHDVHKYRLHEIALHLGCHESTVSRRIKAARKASGLVQDRG